MDNWRLVHDNLHMLKGDLLPTTLGKSMITILGLIKLMLLGNRSQDPDANVERWHTLRDIQCHRPRARRPRSARREVLFPSGAALMGQAHLGCKR